ncbi:PDZ domain-containing protein [Roseibacillus persicicus]|uniref:S1C family serine protease n=2 Tax=Roseibacillus persicicus TaxID=454148 RepID=UPI00398B8878
MKMMKIGTNKIGCSILFLGLASSPLLTAVERPAELDEKPHQLKNEAAPLPAPEPQPEKKIAVVEAIPGEKEQAQDVIPYLGIGSTPVDELVSGHLGIDHGVVIQQVHQGSGAAKAGLQKNDILLSFDGRKISTPLDLRDAVQGREVGDEVAVSLIRKGKEQEQKVVLEERPAGLPGIPRGVRGLGQLQQVWPGDGEIPAEAQEQIERFRNMIDQEFDGVALGLKLNELFHGNLPEGDGQIDLDMNTESSVTWSDGDGTITMNMKNGQTEVKVRNNAGDVVYEGPWETPQDKEAVDPEIRERIENMGVQRQGNQLKFWMEGLPGGR